MEEAVAKILGQHFVLGCMIIGFCIFLHGLFSGD